MKKRILGLALALMMIISLLPLTAMAEPSPSAKVRVSDPVSGNLDAGLGAGQSEYFVFEDVMDTTDPTLAIGNKPVKTSEAPATGGYIKVAYTSEGVLTITLNNVNYKRSASSSTPFIQAYKNTATGATSEFDVIVELVGTNKIEGPNAGMKFDHAGKTTIQGSGSLEITMSQSHKKGAIWCGATSELLIKDTTVKITSAGGSSTRYAIVSHGPITLDGANVDITNDNGTSLTTRTGTTGDINAATLNDSAITIKNNSTFSGKVGGGTAAAIATNGTVTFENANVYISHSNTRGSGTGSAYSVLEKAPTITGTYSVKQASATGYTKDVTYKEYDEFGLTAGDQLERGGTEGTLIKTINLVHQHVAGADDSNCTTALTCACGYEMAPATQHIAGANADDCTKDTICGNTGCTQVFEAKKGDAHVAGQDDGDCTTDIKCVNCDQVATKGAEKHVWDRENCSVAGTCTTPGCTQTVAAGTHTGGTATCKDKAKCAECGEAYGELGACAPAADDGDCTTDIKCSVCGKTTTAGEAAHKYTDKNDTTCDNAGCTNTRKVEGTENPKTGDNSAIAVVAALMVTAAAAFVTTKKFAR